MTEQDSQGSYEVHHCTLALILLETVFLLNVE